MFVVNKILAVFVLVIEILHIVMENLPFIFPGLGSH